MGEQNIYVWGNSQYDNPEYDAIIEKMDGASRSLSRRASGSLASSNFVSR